MRKAAKRLTLHETIQAVYGEALRRLQEPSPIVSWTVSCDWPAELGEDGLPRRPLRRGKTKK
jgi:hypothetical protein